MFKSLLGFWKGKDFLAKVFEEFNGMLGDSKEMFIAVCNGLFEDVDKAGLKKEIYETDKRINMLQKDIRKRIVEHLALQPTVDVTACLLLMSVVKDAERLGDYAKNLYEVAVLLDEPIDRALFTEYFNHIDKDILGLFEQTRDAFVRADEAKAKLAWSYEKGIAKECDRIVERAAHSDLPVNQAVCFALLARHFKRIMAHLVNIATSVILPLSELDYFDERTVND